MRDFVQQLLRHPGIAPMVAHHRGIPGREASFAEPARPLPDELRQALEARGISRLWSHQAQALDAARAGRNVLTVTPTASGKTLVFALPVLETVLDAPGTKALFLYPTKALAQDQAGGLRGLAAATGRLRPPRLAIYDGDTPAAERRKIKADPPDILVTNPDMLHAGILAHHAEWRPFLEALRWVVVDELHVYRGIFGAHVHHILRRLVRLCASAGSRPQFLAASATVGNPGEFAELARGRGFRGGGSLGRPRRGTRGGVPQPGDGLAVHRGGPCRGGSRGARTADDRLHQGPQDHRAAPRVDREGGARAQAPPRALPGGIPSRGEARDRVAPVQGGPPRRPRHERSRAGDRRRRPRRVRARRVSRLDDLVLAADRPRRAEGPRRRSW